MHSWQSGDIEANGLRIHYTRTGGAKPPIVLAHGVTDDGLCWTPVAEALEASYDVIMVDARGHGLSDAPEKGYDPASQAADLHGVIAGLGLKNPILLGHSMGAVTVLVLAGLDPAVPRATLLEDPPPFWLSPAEPSPEDAQRVTGMRDWFLGLKHQTREELIEGQRKAAPAWSEAELGPWADSKLRVSPHVADIFDPDSRRFMDWPTVLASARCPMLLIRADPALGAIVTAELGADLQKRIPQLRIAHIPGAGHNIRREQFERYMAVVQTFLAGLQE